MKDESDSAKPFVFIVGSPRSGTTLLGEILDLHPDIGQWYEPYFVWRKFFRDAEDDQRTASEAAPKVKQYIKNSFVEYRRKIGHSIVVDKSPGNSLTIPFILEIFPDAHFIHVLRDGRDVTLSINKEWKKRQGIVSGGFSFSQALRIIKQWLKRQPFLKDKLKALWFETHGHLFDRSKHFNRLRWNGNVGWGPRFAGWKNDFSKYSNLEFNALQWVHCVETIRKNWQTIPENHRVEIRYEDLISNPQETISIALRFLKVDPSQDFFDALPEIAGNNYNKWRNEFSESEIDLIKPVLDPVLEEMNYVSRFPW